MARDAQKKLKTDLSGDVQKKSKNRSRRGLTFHMYHLDRASQILPLAALRASSVDVDRGLPSDFGDQSTAALIQHLEEKIRAGGYQHRLHLQDLIPVCSAHEKFPRGIDLWHLKGRQVHFDIASCPDLFIMITRAMCTRTNNETELVTFVRSCLPFLYSSRRTQSETGWSKAATMDLITVFRCCMPSLMSLFPQHGIKDVNFWLRVSLYSFWQRIMISTHDERNRIFTALKPLMRVCFVEYMFYYMVHVTSVPYNQNITLEKLDVLYSNAMNTGQQLRIELNSTFLRLHENSPDRERILSEESVMAILSQCNISCQVMYERNLRSSRVLFSDLTTRNPNTQGKDKTLSRKTGVTTDAFDHRDMDCVPYTSNFCLFEMICTKRGIAPHKILTLWEYTHGIRVHELTTEHMKLQLQALHRQGIRSKEQIRNASTLLLCLRCTRNNTFPTYRSDLRTEDFSCSKCGLGDMCVHVSMLGRVVFIKKIPIVLCTQCSDVVVYSGHPGLHECLHVPWGKHVFTAAFQSHLLSKSLMFFSSSAPPGNRNPCHVVSRQFMNERISGNISAPMHTDDSMRACCMCKSGAVAKTYRLIDIYSQESVIVRVCARHALMSKWNDITVSTLQQFICISNFASKV